MGIFYMDVRMVSKAKQSAVAKAAYVSGENLYSERDEESKGYGKRLIVPDSFILAPEHAPDWVKDREKLWNEVEKIEKPFNSQLLREVVVALPIELNREQQLEMVKEYVQENFVDVGMVADVNIHRDKEENPHAHILLTIRPFDENGQWWKTKSKSKYILDKNGDFTYHENGKKRTTKIELTDWNDRGNVLKWREKFAEKVNEFYVKNEIDSKVSHLSYKEQGIEKEAKNRLTLKEYQIEKREKKKAIENGEEYKAITYYGALNEKVEAYNQEIETINQRIKEIERTPIQNENQFEDVRNNFEFNVQEKQSLDFVIGRNKTDEIDYETALKTSESIEYWKGSIDKKNRAFDRERTVLQSALKQFNESNKSIIKFGFKQEVFKEDYEPRVNELDNKYKKLANEFEGFATASKHAVIALHTQKEILKREFDFLYPEYKLTSKHDTKEVNEIMYKYVESFKNEKTIKTNVPEFDYPIMKDSSHLHFRDKVYREIDDYQKQSKAYFSLKRKLEQSETDYKESIQKQEQSNSSETRANVYKESINYLSLKKEFENHSIAYDKTKNGVYNSLIELYGTEQKSVIEKVPDRQKVEMLENYLDSREVNELGVDLSKVDWKDFNTNQTNYVGNQNDNQSGSNVGNFISDLIEQAQRNESNDLTEEEKRRRRNRKKKLTKEEKLEMEQ